VGFADNVRVAVPVIDAPEYVKDAETATREGNAGFMTVMLEGRYTDAYLEEAGGDAPKFTEDELRSPSSSPRTAARRRTWSPMTAGCTTPTG
jgi:beta-glucosidase